MTCRSSTLLCTALLLSSAACIVREPGTSVTVEVVALQPSADEAAQQLATDQGYSVTLDQLYLVLSRVELLPCPEATSFNLYRELFGVSVAHAHGQNTETAWAVPNVLAPLQDAGPVAFAMLQPPARAFCALRVTLAAADADAERMPTDIDMNGLSLAIAGTYSDEPNVAGVPFFYESYAATSMDLPLLDTQHQPTRVELSEDRLQVKLRVELAYQRLFDGLPLFPGAFSGFGEVVLSQALTHAAVIVE
jgi:hypothetical protein